MIATNKYALKQTVDTLVFDPADGSHLATIEDAQSMTLTNGSESVDATGRDGALLASWDTSKTARLSGSNGLISEGILAVQTGADVETVTDFVGAMISDVLETTDGLKATTVYTASSSVVGNELQWLYVNNADGSLGRKYSQSSIADATHFSYDPATKVITLPTSAITAGSKITVFYTPVISSAKRIRNEAGKFPKVCKVISNALFQDVSTGKDYHGQIIFSKAKASGNFDFTYGDSAAVQAFEFTAMTGCGVNALWDIIIFDEDDIVA